MKKFIVVVGAALALSACSGRWESGSTIPNPHCMKDGSVVFWEFPNSKGEYKTVGSHANCPWAKADIASK